MRFLGIALLLLGVSCAHVEQYDPYKYATSLEKKAYATLLLFDLGQATLVRLSNDDRLPEAAKEELKKTERVVRATAITLGEAHLVVYDILQEWDGTDTPDGKVRAAVVSLDLALEASKRPIEEFTAAVLGYLKDD